MAKGKLGIREPDNFARGVIVVNVATPVTLLRETYTVFRQQRAHFSGVERPYSRTEVYVRGTKLGRKSFATPSPPLPLPSVPGTWRAFDIPFLETTPFRRIIKRKS